MTPITLSFSTWWASVSNDFYVAFVKSDRWKLYIEGLGYTILIAVFAALIGIVLGTIIALTRMSFHSNGKKTFLNRIATAYVDIIRGTPSVLQLLIMYFIVLRFIGNGYVVAIITFGLNSAAYVSEIVRAGILAVDTGQSEAGRSLGLSKRQTLKSIVLPQAFKNALPPICNEFIVLLKETAIVGYVALTDLTRTANQIVSRTYKAFMPLIGAAVIYFIVIKILSVLFSKLERRLRQGDNR